jgi:RNA polymerase sigma factor (sigma-70 family)
MSAESNQLGDERLLLSRCINGDAKALGILRDRHNAPMLRVLISKGASLTQAEELLADLWSECVGDGEGKVSLLEKFSGKCSLQSWLFTVSIRRLIDLQRRQARVQDVTSDAPPDATSFFNKLPDTSKPATAIADDVLIRLLRESLEEAFKACPAEGLLMLRLVHQYGLTGRQLAQMWGCHEATISRSLKTAMTSIQHTTLQELKKRDRWLELTWEDFVELCETQEIGFL